MTKSAKHTKTRKPTTRMTEPKTAAPEPLTFDGAFQYLLEHASELSAGDVAQLAKVVPGAASTPTEPTFTLKELHALMGDGYVPVHRPADALDFAEEALGAAVATLVLVSEALAETNVTLANAVHNARMRSEAAIRVLGKLGCAQRGEAQS